MSQSRNQTVTTMPDAATLRFAEEARRRALDIEQRARDINSMVNGNEQRVAGLSGLERQGMNLAGFVGGQVPGQWMGAQGIVDRGAAAGGVLGGLAGTLPMSTGLLGQQAMQGNDIAAGLAGGFGQGAGLFSSLAGLTPEAVAQQQAAVGGLLSPGLAAQAGALGGPNVAGFFNPYQQQVIDATRQQFDSARNRMNTDISARATAAGAFGGGREAVVRGQALADLARDESQQVAGLLSAGYQDAMARAMQDQQFRFGAGQAMTGQGLGVLDSIAGRGMAAGGQLFGGGLAAQQQGANALSQLFGGGQGAAQFTAGLGANAQSQLLANSLNGIGLLGQFGGLDRGVQQAILDQQRIARDEPLNRLLAASGALGLGFGGQGTVQTMPQTRNAAAGFLGGAGSGAAIGGQIGGPWGAGIGAIGGGLLGLFG